MIPKTELINYFLSELEDNINGLIEGLKELENKGFSIETLEVLYRIAHTLKGTASLVNYNKIALLAHKLENLFDALINNEIEQSNLVFYLLEKLVDLIIKFFNEISVFKEEKSELDEKFLSLIDEILKNKETAQINKFSKEFNNTPAMNSIKVEIELKESLFEILGEIISKKNMLINMKDKLKSLITEISDRVEKLSEEIKVFPFDSFFSSANSEQRIIDKFFTEFRDLSYNSQEYYHVFKRKISEINSDVAENLKELSFLFENLFFILNTLEEETNNIKDRLLSLRLIPIGKLLNKFHEPIRAFAKNLRKNIEIEIQGSDIKIDKIAFQALYEPLMHILKNAVIHGIETKEERLLSDKPEKGKIKVNVKKEGKYVFISITDDGRGIDIDKLRQVALNKGFLSQQELSSMKDEEIISFIFYPHFSTSQDVDFHSGRGLGLNIAKRAISKLNGTIEVLTEFQKETTFLIKIPQSQFLCDILIFSHCNIEFAVPIDCIEEILSEEDFLDARNKRVINHKNKTIPVKILEMSSSLDGNATDKGYIILFNFSGVHKALLVDNILRHESTIIQPLGDFLSGLSQYLGYIMSNNGAPIFVLDPERIFENDYIFNISKSLIQENMIFKGTILIVDDSISLRNFLKSFLEIKNFKVYTAKNGIEALNILRKKKIDLIITDLEMPTMHGYTLIKSLRQDPSFKKIPVVVLTCRDTKEHKKKAIELGANEFLLKPFDENEIMEIINKFFAGP